MPPKAHTSSLLLNLNVHRSIVDTSTLMVFLGLSFLERKSQAFERSQEDEIFAFIGKTSFRNNPRRQQEYKDLFERIHEIITTSHVIGELNSHITRGFRGNEMLREDFLRHTLRILTAKRLDETLITILDITIEEQFNDITARIGIVDIGLLLLARNTNLPLLTEDGRTLGAEAANAKLKKIIVIPNHL